MAVIVLFYGVSHWNSWFNEMLYMPNDRTLWPLALITREIIVSSSVAALSDGGVMTQEKADAIKYATIIVSTLPILCLYPFCRNILSKVSWWDRSKDKLNTIFHCQAVPASCRARLFGILRLEICFEI